MPEAGAGRQGTPDTSLDNARRSPDLVGAARLIVGIQLGAALIRSDRLATRQMTRASCVAETSHPR